MRPAAIACRTPGLPLPTTSSTARGSLRRPPDDADLFASEIEQLTGQIIDLPVDAGNLPLHDVSIMSGQHTSKTLIETTDLSCLAYQLALDRPQRIRSAQRHYLAVAR